MRTARLIAVGTAIALSGAVTAGPATAAAGVGTTTVSTSLLRVQVGANGSLLDLRLLGDDARATVDPKVGSTEAFSRLTALSLSSSALPAPLNSITVPSPPIESKSPGGLGSVTSAAIDLANPVTGVAVPSYLLSGSVAPATLTSAVDADGARSSLGSSLGNLAGVGGLLSADSLASTLDTAANATKADGKRVVSTSAITVLDLGALIDGLGLLLADLPVSAVTGILDQLGVPVGTLAPGDLTDAVSALSDGIDGLQALIPAGALPTDPITAAVPAELGTLLPDLGTPVPVQNTTTVAEVQASIDALQNTLSGLLATAMTALDALKLLEVDGINVGVVATATDTLGGSVSAVNAKIGEITLGGVTLPAVDLLGTAAQLNAAVADVNGIIGDALGSIAPGLANVVDVDLLAPDADNGVRTAGGYNKAIAGLTAVAASVTPPADLSAIISTLQSATGVGETIIGLGGTVPALSTVMGTLETALGSVQALAGGANIRIAQLRSTSDFVAAAPASPGTELPRTGSNNTTALAAFGTVLAALAIGMRRYVVAPARKG